MNTIQATRHYSDQEMEQRFAATLLTDKDYDLVIDDDCIVFKPNGAPLLIYRRGVIPLDQCLAGYQNLYEASFMSGSTNRGMAGGRGKIDGAEVGRMVGGTRIHLKRDDGTLSRTNRAIMSTLVGHKIRRQGGRLLMERSDGQFEERPPADVNSGIVGFVDGNPRHPYCRLTAYNLNYPERFSAALPMIRSVDACFKATLPDRYAAQRAVVERTSPDFYISGTVFTTLTVNLNFQTAVHKDAGDLKEGFGVMAALRKGNFQGCYTCFPQFRIAANMQTGDVLLADVHEWHGNTPLVPLGKYERLSLVFYYREKIQECGSATQELEKAKQRRGITHLKEWRP